MESKELPVLLAKCYAIGDKNYLNVPYENIPVLDRYSLGGDLNRGSYVYHYCTVSVLQQIIENKTLRFSDVRFLNDETEFQNAINLAMKILNKNDKQYSQEFVKLLSQKSIIEQLKNYKQKYRIALYENDRRSYVECRAYTCSFSMKGNSLPMWKNYASGTLGVNIEFLNIGNAFESGKEIIKFGSILYEEKDKEKCINRMFDDLYDVFNKSVESGCDIENHIIYSYINAMNNMRCFFKNKNYKKENEFRAILLLPDSEAENITDIKKGFFLRGNMLIPYVDVPLDSKFVNRIVVNPFVSKTNFEKMKLGIEELLIQNRIDVKAIYKSNISIWIYKIAWCLINILSKRN